MNYENELLINNITFIKNNIKNLSKFYLERKIKITLYIIIIFSIILYLILNSQEYYQAKITLIVPPSNFLSYRQDDYYKVQKKENIIDFNNKDKLDSIENNIDLSSLNKNDNYKIYITLLKSDRVSKKIIKELGLLEKFNTKHIDEAINILDIMTSIYIDNNFMELSINTNDKKLSKSILKLYIIELDKIVNNFKKENYNSLNIYLNEHLDIINLDIKNYLSQLNQINQKYNIFDSDLSLKYNLDIKIDLNEKLFDLESDINAYDNIFTDNNINMLELKSKNNYLKKQIELLDKSSNISSNYKISEYNSLLNLINVQLTFLEKMYLDLFLKNEILYINSKQMPLKVIDNEYLKNNKSYSTFLQKIIDGLMMSIFISIHFILLEYCIIKKIFF